MNETVKHILVYGIAIKCQRGHDERWKIVHADDGSANMNQWKKNCKFQLNRVWWVKCHQGNDINAKISLIRQTVWETIIVPNSVSLHFIHLQSHAMIKWQNQAIRRFKVNGDIYPTSIRRESIWFGEFYWINLFIASSGL